MRKYVLLLMTLTSIAFLSCGDNPEIPLSVGELAGLPGGPLGDPDRLFFTSFEFPADTAEWPKYGGMELSSDVPEGGGNQSVQIAGGCIYPHAGIEIPGPQEDSYLRIECWGRNLALGGGISLSRVNNPDKQIHVRVQDTEWKHYTSGEALFCPAGEKLRIEMDSGGIVYSAMRVDLLTVRGSR